MPLKDYIGLESVSDSPESGYYVNMLPGMTTELADNLNAEEETTLQMWDKIQDRSILRFKNDIQNNLPSAELNRVVYQTKRLRKGSDTIDNVSGEANYRGVYLAVPQSKYTRVYVDQIYIYNRGSEITADVKIFDMNDGEEVYTSSETISEGLNEISIDQEFSLRFADHELFICVDATNLDSIETKSEYYFWYNEDFSCAAPEYVGRSLYLDVRAGEIGLNETVVRGNIELSSNGKGVGVKAEIICSLDEFIEVHKRHFTNAWLYLLGAETLKEKVGSPRMNFFTASNLEQSEGLRQGFEGDYRSNLKNTLKSITLEGEGFCFECKQSVSTEGMLP